MVELGSWLRGSVVEHSVTNSKADNVTVAGKKNPQIITSFENY